MKVLYRVQWVFRALFCIAKSTGVFTNGNFAFLCAAKAACPTPRRSAGEEVSNSAARKSRPALNNQYFAEVKRMALAASAYSANVKADV